MNWILSSKTTIKFKNIDIMILECKFSTFIYHNQTFYKNIHKSYKKSLFSPKFSAMFVLIL